MGKVRTISDMSRERRAQAELLGIDLGDTDMDSLVRAMPNNEITNGEMFAALFNAIGALAEKLTGEKLYLTFYTASGGRYTIYPSGYARWVKE